jgi:hypothetical protein
MFPIPWEIREVGEDKKPVPLTSPPKCLTLSNMDFDKVINLILDDASERKRSAGYDGKWDDNGATKLEEQVKFFRYGLAHVMPSEWKDYSTKAKVESDPEYAEFLRLQEKFKVK